MKQIFAILFLFAFVSGVAQVRVQRVGHDTLIVRSSGGGTPIFHTSPNGDTLYLHTLSGGILSGTATLDFPNTPAGTTSTLSVNVPGAVAGDAVAVGTPLAAVLTGVVYLARVTAPGVVTVIMYNSATGSRNPAPGAFKVRVIQ
jgi:hypothetical protein